MNQRSSWGRVLDGLVGIAIFVWVVILYSWWQQDPVSEDEKRLIVDLCTQAQYFNACMSFKDSDPHMCEIMGINQSIKPAYLIAPACREKKPLD